MPTSLGAHSPRVDAARELLTKKGRKRQGRFSFEGPTLLQEAIDAGVPIESIYVTRDAFERIALVGALEREGATVYTVDERAMKRLSDVETPTGLVAVAPLRFRSAAEIFARPGVVLVLADVNDPGNTGTLLRTAEAFGAAGVILGSLGAEAHLPKVIRSAMGAVFRLPLATAEPADVARALGDRDVTGLAAGTTPLHALDWPENPVLVVGNERHGLGRWEAVCTRHGSIPMSVPAESLNAAVAGSIALYEATKRSFF